MVGNYGNEKNKGKIYGPLMFEFLSKIKLIRGKSVAYVYDKNGNHWKWVFDRSKVDKYIWPDGSETNLTFPKIRYKTPKGFFPSYPVYQIYQGHPSDFDPTNLFKPNKAAEEQASIYREAFTLGREFERYGDNKVSEKIDMFKKIVTIIAFLLIGLIVIYLVGSVLGYWPNPLDAAGGFFKAQTSSAAGQGTGGGTITGQ